MEKFEPTSAADLLKKKFPDPKTHPNLLYPFTGIVINKQAVNRWRQGEDLAYYSVTVLCCPYCGKQHHHGVSFPKGKTIKRGHNFGHRIEHCVMQNVKCSKEFVHGYILVNTATYRPK